MDRGRQQRLAFGDGASGCPRIEQEEATIIVVRNVLQSAFGRGGELAAQMAEGNRAIVADLGMQRRSRVLTDLGGSFDSVVIEVEAECLAE